MKRYSLLVLLVVVSAFFANNLRAQSSVCFTSASDNLIRTGKGATSLTINDFNLDGTPDIVVANRWSNNISILIGQGDRSFEAPEIIAQVTEPLVVVSGDFNNDSKYDLAVGLFEAPLKIFFGDGTGQFEAGGDYDDFVKPNMLKTGDFNGDGNTDLLGVLESSIAVMFGSASGDFGDAVEILDGFTANVLSLDLTGDDVDDIALSDGTTLHIFEGKISGELTDHEIISTEDYNVVSADFNGDHHEDLILPLAGKILLGNGSGGFPNQFDIPSMGDGKFVAHDLNGDELIDIVQLNQFYSVKVFYATSTTSFDDPIGLYAGGSPREIVATDMDADEHTDLIFPDFDPEIGGITVLYNNGESFTTPEGYFVNDEQVSMVVDDINNDGRRDVISSSVSDKRLIAMIQNTNGKFIATKSENVDVGSGPLIVGDYNGDSKKDLATIDYLNNKVLLFYGNGGGSFSNGPTFDNNVITLDGADFNGDGKRDLVGAVKSTNFVAVMIGDGAGGFTKTDIDMGLSASAVLTGDFNNDDKIDIAAIADGNNNVALRPGNGNGTFGSLVNMESEVVLGSHTYAPDLNSDGKADLVSTNALSWPGYVITILINTGTGFSNRAAIEPNIPAELAAFGDLDGDNKTDMVLGGAVRNSVAIYTGNGDGTFNAPVQFATGATIGFAASDIDDDGALDIVTSQYLAGMLVILRNNTASITQIGTITTCDDVIELNANKNGFSYQWSTPEGFSYGQSIEADTRGIYSLVVSNANESCKTMATVTLEGKPATPDPETTQPTCLVETGSIAIETQDGHDVYSFDNGDTFQSDNVKSNLLPGEYHVIIQNSDGCNSDAVAVTIDPQPTAPDKPEAEAIDPTCTESGSIIVAIQKEGDTYSFDNGETFQGLNYAEDLAPGNYEVVIRRSIDCVSEPTEVAIAEGPEVPGQPTLSGVAAAGSVTLTSSAASGYLWLKDGSPIENADTQTYQATETGSYFVIALSVDGCQSEPSAPFNVIISGDIDEVVAGFYPNPADSYIYYKTTALSFESTMYASNGKRISIVPSRAGDQLVYDVREFSAGVYLLKITVEKSTKTIRWVKR